MNVFVTMVFETPEHEPSTYLFCIFLNPKIEVKIEYVQVLAVAFNYVADWIVRLMMHFIVVDTSEKFMFGPMTSSSGESLKRGNQITLSPRSS